MNEKDKTFKMCYINSGTMYFTDDFDNQRGDDWDDAPYERNAAEPYAWNECETDEWNREHKRGHLRYVGFYSPYEWLEQPCDHGRYSVEEINRKVTAWLYSDIAGGLMAGATMEEAIAWCQKAGVKWGELK